MKRSICMDKMETDRCKKLVSMIQQLEPTEMEELFKMLHANGCKYTSNNHGVFLNLSWLSEDILQKIETYVAFCFRSKTEVHKYESLCDALKQQPAKKKEEAEVPTVTSDTSDAVASEKRAASKVSSSMKFYLLKKRYAKQGTQSTTAKNELEFDSA